MDQVIVAVTRWIVGLSAIAFGTPYNILINRPGLQAQQQGLSVDCQRARSLWAGRAMPKP
ncbi:hypothetical protein [Bradyrhizobium sp. Tv2a-2]|uniref:hypothetical protein n=1 Tax=Bradyrhizobium sp. Tv2a-2 TaxID=113395 RepID=UPI000429FDE1|nr:hypothetical protein [Bradyrhizobium sp. Tv2a-2]